MNRIMTKYVYPFTVFDVFCLGIGTLSVVIYRLYSSVELPHLSWFDQFHIIDDYFNGSLSSRNFFTRFAEHGMLGTNLLFLFNVAFLRMTTFFDVYVSIFAFFLIGIIGVQTLKKISGNENSLLYKLNVALICFIILSVMYETAGGMETQVCLGYLFTILSVYLINDSFLEHTSTSYKIIVALMILVSINVFGTLYVTAAYPPLILVCGYYLFKPARRTWSLFLIVWYILLTILYFYEYDIGKQGSVNTASLLSITVDYLRHPKSLLLSIFSYNASSVLGYAVFVSSLPHSVYLFVGFVVSVIQLYALLLFFWRKLYNISWLPLLFIGYSLGVAALVMLGRAHDWEFLSAHWYQMHYKIGLVGIVSVLVILLRNGNSQPFLRIIQKCSLLFIALCLAYGTIAAVKRAPAVRMYYLMKQPYLFAEDENAFPVPPDSGNGFDTILMATPEMLVKSIKLMKRHNLSVYKERAYYEKFMEVQAINNRHVTRGLFEDKWIGEDFVTVFDSGSEGRVELTCYFPNDVKGIEKGMVTVNDTVFPFEVKQGFFRLVYSIPPNDLVVLRIHNDFHFNNPPDARDLCFVLSNIKVF